MEKINIHCVKQLLKKNKTLVNFLRPIYQQLRNSELLLSLYHSLFVDKFPYQKLDSNYFLSHLEEKYFRNSGEFSSISKVKSIIENTTKEVISFDFFDTLFERPFAKPSDLFLYIEEQYNCKNFASARIEAERKARQHMCSDGEVSLDEIYLYLDEKYSLFKEIELNLELKFIRPIQEKIELLKLAIEKGKKVIIISDMYLPKSFFCAILSRYSIPVHKIFVSCDYRKTKQNGNLFCEAMRQLNIDPSLIIHIGDNYESDFRVPKLLGIEALRLPTTLDSFRDDKFSVWLYANYELNHSTFSSMLLYLVANFFRTRKCSVLELLGFSLAGPLVLAYLNYIEKVSNKMQYDHLVFVSRDGYLLQKNYLLLWNTIPSTYVYSSRRVYLGCTMDFADNPERLKTLLSDFSNARNISLKISSTSHKKNLELFNAFETQIKEWSEQNLKNYADYLKSLQIDGRKIASVDLTTSHFSSNRLFKRILKDNYLAGFYSCKLGNDISEIVENYFWPDGLLITERDLPAISLSEFLLSSPEATVIAIDEAGAPIFWGPKPQYFDLIDKGVSEFCKESNDIFDLNVYLSDFKNWVSMVQLFFKFVDEGTISELEKYDLEDFSEKNKISSYIRYFRERDL